MTAAIVPFVGREKLTADQNLKSFIAQAKTHRWFALGASSLEWNANTWDLRPFVKTRGQKAGLVMNFTTFESTIRGPRSDTAIDFEQPFLDAAKAILVEFARTTKTSAPSKVVIALRCIEKAFRDLGRTPDITGLDPIVLDRAADIVRETYADKWNAGRFLERIADEIVNRGRLAELHLLWKSPFEYQGAVRNDRINKEGGAGEGADKLPHLKCILDLAGVFHSSDDVRDLVVTAWFALAMFAPQRVNEILTLPLRCGTEMEGVYGLSWRPLKGGQAMTKFAAADESADVAREAIRRLDRLGAKSRIAAKWYQENPGQLYLPPGMEHFRGQLLTRPEIEAILGKRKAIIQGSKLDEALEYSGQRTSDPSRRRGETTRGSTPLYTFDSVARYVASVLPEDFPFADRVNELPVSDALFCLPLHIMRGDGDTLEYVPDVITYSQIRANLGDERAGLTIAARNNLLDPKTGKPWRLNTHQPRHLLNTLAQSKHLAQTLIAFWSGRKRVDQNAWYNHIPQGAFIEAFVLMGEQAPKSIDVVGPLDDKVEDRARKESITYDDALRLELGSTITTRYGLCRHNFALTPCPKDKNCIGCGENTFIKGDERQLAEARKQLEISRLAVEHCEKAIADGEPGVEKWLEKHREKEARWAMAVEMLTDDTIPDGTLITLPPVKTPQAKTGLAAEVRAAEPPSDFVMLEDE